MNDDWRPWPVDCYMYFGAGLPASAWSPYAWPLVEIRREGSNEIHTVNPSQLDPMFNVAGLWWRPAGARKGTVIEVEAEVLEPRPLLGDKQ